MRPVVALLLLVGCAAPSHAPEALVPDAAGFCVDGQEWSWDAGSCCVPKSGPELCAALNVAHGGAVCSPEPIADGCGLAIVTCVCSRGDVCQAGQCVLAPADGGMPGDAGVGDAGPVVMDGGPPAVCAQDMDCANDGSMFCLDGQCYPIQACTRDNQCPPGQICNRLTQVCAGAPADGG